MVLIAVLAACLLSACAGRGQADADEPRVLRVAATYGNAAYKEDLRAQFLETFQFLHPAIEIEIVTAIDWDAYYRYRNPEEPVEEPNPAEEMRKLMEGPNPPDVVIIDSGMLPYLIGENLLLPLDGYIEKSKFDLDGLAPIVIEWLRNEGNRSIYGLAPRFTSQALIYNKKMFLEAGVPFPQDGMTWQEIFDLAARISAHYGGEKFGFAFQPYRFGNVLDALIQYAGPLNLKWFSPDGGELMIQSDSWKRVIGDLIPLYEQNVIPDMQDLQREPDRLFRTRFDFDVFLSGEVAMALVSYSYLQDVVTANQQAGMTDGFDGIEWDVVTYPQHPEAPGVGGSLTLDGLMGINARAGNPDDAWKLISFVNSEEWAKVKSRSTGGYLVSRLEQIRPIPGVEYNLPAFYSMQPSPPWIDSYQIIRNPEIWEALYLGDSKIQEVLSGQKTLDEALKEWQTEGNALIKERREKGGNDPVSPTAPVVQVESRVVIP